MTARRKRVNEAAYYPPELPYQPMRTARKKANHVERLFKVRIRLWAKNFRKQTCGG